MESTGPEAIPRLHPVQLVLDRPLHRGEGEPYPPVGEVVVETFDLLDGADV